MNVDNDSKESVTDLRLSLDYPNQGTAHLFENSGAGANAASRVDMSYEASDHLTELVWSPRKGLSIKCTNCSSTSAEESRRILAMGIGHKATSANQANEVKAVTAVTSSKSSGRNVRVGIACQSAYSPINEGSRCNSSPCLKDAPELNVSFAKSMLEVSRRKKSFFDSDADQKLCTREKTRQPQLRLASNIDDENLHSSSMLEENQERKAFKKQKLSSDGDVSVFKGKSYCREESPTESKVREYRRKGKAKVLSDAIVECGEEESRGSIKSCSSAGSFCSRQRKRSLRQDFITESKRTKTTIHQSSHPISLVNGSSSFISWISNMTKGINKANKNGTPCLALTLTPSGAQRENREWELTPHVSNDRYPHQRSGFQNIFQSIYRTNSKVQEPPANTDHHQKSGRPFDMVDVVPLTMHEMTSSSCKGDQSSGNGGRQLKPRKGLSRIGDNREQKSFVKVASCDLLTNVQNVKLSYSRSSPDICGTQENDSSPPQINAGLTYVSDPLQSFWITRFCPKAVNPKSVTDNQGQILLIDNQTHNSKNSIFRYNEVDRVMKAKDELDEDLKKLGERDGTASESDASVGPKEDAHFITAASDCNIDQILITKRLKSSEAMASMFARRLDAIKRMTMPAGITGNASGVDTTCFYCGKKGHTLHKCPEFTESKLEGLMETIGLPESSENALCLCIRCFQLGHSANDCPATGVSVCGPLAIPNNEFLETSGYRSGKYLLLENNNKLMADIPPTPCNQNIIEPEPELYKLYNKSGPVIFELEESAPVRLPNSIGGKSSDIPKGYFDAVRLLRLSRREILKLMDSQIDLSNMEGFFLRLRLGNAEKGTVGAGYHVAYIDGEQSEELCRGSKFILPVNISGIKIMVGSRSISNQEFLEDELMAWWSASIKNGVQLPTQEELNDKLLQRNMLQL